MSIDLPPPWWSGSKVTQGTLQKILDEVSRISLVMRITRVRTDQMANVTQALLDQIAATKGVQESAVQALTALHTALEEAIASNDMTAVAAAVADLKANTDGLAAAIAANPVVEAEPAPEPGAGPV